MIATVIGHIGGTYPTQGSVDDSRLAFSNMVSPAPSHPAPSNMTGEGTNRSRARKRWPRHTRPEQWEHSPVGTTVPGQDTVKSNFQSYVGDRPEGGPPWLHDPDVPTTREIGTLVDAQVQDQEVAIYPNKIKGAWQSKEQYLEAHYGLMRLDAITPLRNAVDEVRLTPSLIEKNSQEHARIYENVYITGVTVARQGLALRTEFSTRRAEKKILWGQSKRLKTGTIVALSPVEDKFKTKCLVAVVASRVTLELIVEPPAKPSIQIFIGDPGNLEIDPQQEWIMVEASGGYWEASRHTLRALQKLHGESFPLSEHIVEVQKAVLPPRYRQDQPFMDLSVISTTTANTSFNVDVIQDWPTLNEGIAAKSLLDSATPPFLSEFDTSQLNALHRILAKRLAIIQGPPGTGKSHVSILALRMLLQHKSPNDPPIIVTAHTNHAVDQLLRHISEFEPDFIRLGGQTTDFDIIKPRTLFQIREKQKTRAKASLKQIWDVRKQTVETLSAVLEPLTSKLPVSAETLLEYGLLTQDQFYSLEHVESSWVGVSSLVGSDTSTMGIYCEDTLVPAEKKKGLLLYGNKYEEYDETEKLEEEELETMNELNDEFEILRGKNYTLRDGFTTRNRKILNDDGIRTLLRDTQDMTTIPSQYRGDIYNYLQKSLKVKIRDRVREIAGTCRAQAQAMQIGRWESDYPLLRKARIIGMTTTGLSKNRGLLASLNPTTVLIEEAAETLEAYTTAACFPSLEHLILVGDHQQLRGQCASVEFEGEPCFLDVSMFERLINNEIEFTQLTMQRRMRPEFRKIINPIYPALEDHCSVHDRKNIPGMGGVNCHFMSHTFMETDDDALSKKNEQEARLVAGFYEYLVYNQVKMSDITILTFYNGQRSLIRHLLMENPNFEGMRINIATVDSYQGEENEVVLLSLVRSNTKGQIGFLKVLNRVCVALSRARRGFYIFGNADMLAQHNKEWRYMLNIMRDSGQIMGYLPLKCENHGEARKVSTYHHFMDQKGGCQRDCGGVLACGHPCTFKCHVIPHESIKCLQVCPNMMPCGHQCDQLCWKKPCDCGPCAAAAQKRIKGKKPPTDHAWRTRETRPLAEQQDSIQAWTNFAQGGVRKEDARLRELQQAEMEARRVTAEMGKLEVVEGGSGAPKKKVRRRERREKKEEKAVEKEEKAEEKKEEVEEEALIELEEVPAKPSAHTPGKRRIWREIHQTSLV